MTNEMKLLRAFIDAQGFVMSDLKAFVFGVAVVLVFFLGQYAGGLI
jgi:hypothetical protein